MWEGLKGCFSLLVLKFFSKKYKITKFSKHFYFVDTEQSVVFDTWVADQRKTATLAEATQNEDSNSRLTSTDESVSTESSDQTCNDTPGTQFNSTRQIFIHLSCFKCCVVDCPKPWISTCTQDFYVSHNTDELFCLLCFKKVFGRMPIGTVNRKFGKSLERKKSFGKQPNPMFIAKTLEADDML